MKRIHLLFVIIVVFVISSCAPAIQLGIGLGGSLASHMLKSSNNSSTSSSEKQPDLILGKQQERIAIGDYEIRVSDGYLKGEPYIHFVAYNSYNRPIRNISFDKKNSEAMEMIKNFNQMSESEKKIFIKEQFMKVTKLDLEPTEGAASVSSYNFSPNSFAPLSAQKF
jgi:hypothetical protein